MRSLSELLLNHAIPGLRQSERRRLCAEAVSEIVGLPVKASQVKYEDEVLSLSLSPVLKSEILLRQTALIELFNSRGVRVRELR
jgi:hypothetical protein